MTYKEKRRRHANNVASKVRNKNTKAIGDIRESQAIQNLQRIPGVKFYADNHLSHVNQAYTVFLRHSNGSQSPRCTLYMERWNLSTPTKTQIPCPLSQPNSQPLHQPLDNQVTELPCPQGEALCHAEYR